MTGFTARQSLSTRHIGKQRSLSVWREYMREVYFKLDIEAYGDDAMAGDLVKRSFAQADVSAFRADAQRVIRSRQLLKDDNVECFCIVFPTQGGFAHRQRGNSGESRAGGVYILNAHEPYEVDIAQGSRMICLSLPCDLVRARIRNVDDLCATSQFADPTLVSTLRHLVESALEVAPSVDPLRLQDLCLEMIDMMILGSAAQEERRSYAEIIGESVITRAKDLMEGHLHDPSFSVSRAAAECGVSVRQLQNVYKQSGSTFTAELLNARLLRALCLLRSQDTAPRLIAEVATDCGFVSQSHFANTYRERFGRSPRDERSKAD